MAKLYHDYLKDMQAWAAALEVRPGKLEAFLFGEPRKTRDLQNPRNQLWQFIQHHFDLENKIDKPIRTDNAKPKKSDPHYLPLQTFLQNTQQSRLQLGISDIENILNAKLPDWAFSRSSSFWQHWGGLSCPKKSMVNSRF